MNDFKWTTIEAITDNLVEIFIDKDIDTFRECRDNIMDMIKDIFNHMEDLQEQVSDLKEELSITRQTMLDVQPEIRNVEIDVKPYRPAGKRD